MCVTGRRFDPSEPIPRSRIIRRSDAKRIRRPSESTLSYVPHPAARDQLGGEAAARRVQLQLPDVHVRDGLHIRQETAASRIVTPGRRPAPTTRLVVVRPSPAFGTAEHVLVGSCRIQVRDYRGPTKTDPTAGSRLRGDDSSSPGDHQAKSLQSRSGRTDAGGTPVSFHREKTAEHYLRIASEGNVSTLRSPVSGDSSTICAQPPGVTPRERHVTFRQATSQRRVNLGWFRRVRARSRRADMSITFAFFPPARKLSSGRPATTRDRCQRLRRREPDGVEVRAASRRCPGCLPSAVPGVRDLPFRR